MHDADDTITSNENLADVWLADFRHYAAHLGKPESASSANVLGEFTLGLRVGEGSALAHIRIRGGKILEKGKSFDEGLILVYIENDNGAASVLRENERTTTLGHSADAFGCVGTKIRNGTDVVDKVQGDVQSHTDVSRFGKDLPIVTRQELAWTLAPSGGVKSVKGTYGHDAFSTTPGADSDAATCNSVGILRSSGGSILRKRCCSRQGAVSAR